DNPRYVPVGRIQLLRLVDISDMMIPKLYILATDTSCIEHNKIDPIRGMKLNLPNNSARIIKPNLNSTSKCSDRDNPQYVHVRRIQLLRPVDISDIMTPKSYISATDTSCIEHNKIDPIRGMKLNLPSDSAGIIKPNLNSISK
ncbi:27993_t:CDS:2, partial [Gigaspora margarita]